MSRVHDAMRRLADGGAPGNRPAGATLSSLVGALIGELSDEVPDDPALEGVRSDILAARRSYETGDKQDLALRFYLAMRSLLYEHALLKERVSQAESSTVVQPAEYTDQSSFQSSPQSTSQSSSASGPY